MTQDERWQHNLAALRQYIARTGTARVPTGHVEHYDGTDVLLGNWVSHQRQHFRHRRLSEARAQVLAGLPGWVWGPQPRGPRRDTSRDAEIVACAEDGMSLAQIADSVGLSRQRVHQILKRARTTVVG